MVGGREVKVDHACTRCSVQGEAGDEQDERVRVEQSLCLAMCAMLCVTQHPTILPFQSQSPKALVMLLGLPNLSNSSSWSCGAP